MKLALVSVFACLTVAVAACADAPADLGSEEAALGEASECGSATPTCAAGDVDLTTAACVGAAPYRQRICTSLCTWSGYSDCGVLPRQLVLGYRVRGAVAQAVLGSPDTEKLLGSCPTVDIDLRKVPAAYVQIMNPRSAPVTIELAVAAPSNVELAVYAHAMLPMTRDQRRACLSDATSAGFTGPRAITIPANETYMLYVQSPDATGQGRVVPLKATIISP